MFEWFGRGGALQKAIVLICMLLIAGVTLRFTFVDVARLDAERGEGTVEAEVQVALRTLERVTADRYNAAEARLPLLEQIEARLAPLDARATRTRGAHSAALAAFVHLVDAMKSPDFDDPGRRRGAVDVLREVVAADADAARSRTDLAPPARLVPSAHAQDAVGSGQGGGVMGLPVSEADMRPLLRLTVMIAAMLATLASGAIYIFTNDATRRASSFKVMTYLGSFVGGALF